MSAFFIGYSEQDIHVNHTSDHNVFFCTYFDTEIHFIELGTLEEVINNVVDGKKKYCIVPFKSIEEILAECENLKIKYQQEKREAAVDYILAINMISKLIADNILVKNTITNTIHTMQSALGYIKDDITNMYQPNNLVDKWNFNADELFDCLFKSGNQLFIESNESELKENYLGYLQESHDAYLIKLSHEHKHNKMGLLRKIYSFFAA